MQKPRTQRQLDNPGGRPTKKTKKLVAELLEAIAGGAPYTICCAAVGVHIDTFMDWKRRDPEFARQVERVAAQGALKRLKKIEQHGEENFAALSWMLECRYPQEFSRPEVQLSVNQSVSTGPQNVVVIGPERAAILANRHEQIRAKTRELLDNRDTSVPAPVREISAGNGQSAPASSQPEPESPNNAPELRTSRLPGGSNLF
jgi:hypothetical protein